MKQILLAITFACLIIAGGMITASCLCKEGDSEESECNKKCKTRLDISLWLIAIGSATMGTFMLLTFIPKIRKKDGTNNKI